MMEFIFAEQGRLVRERPLGRRVAPPHDPRVANTRAPAGFVKLSHARISRWVLAPAAPGVRLFFEQVCRRRSLAAGSR